jgi:hypothetical protein
VARLARHFAFITNRTDEIAEVQAEHRDHAVVEQVIVDLKDQALAHFPSGHFHANGAWTVLAALAHSMLRWTQLLGLPGQTVRAARALRRRLTTAGATATSSRPSGRPGRAHRRPRPPPGASAEASTRPRDHRPGAQPDRRPRPTPPANNHVTDEPNR